MHNSKSRGKFHREESYPFLNKIEYKTEADTFF